MNLGLFSTSFYSTEKTPWRPFAGDGHWTVSLRNWSYFGEVPSGAARIAIPSQSSICVKYSKESNHCKSASNIVTDVANLSSPVRSETPSDVMRKIAVAGATSQRLVCYVQERCVCFAPDAGVRAFLRNTFRRNDNALCDDTTGASR